MHLHLSDVREEAQELVADSVNAASRPSHVLSIFICCLFIKCVFVSLATLNTLQVILAHRTDAQGFSWEGYPQSP